VFRFTYAKTLKPLDQPIKAISQGEFGLPADLVVHLHSSVDAFGSEAEEIVRRAYFEEPFHDGDGISKVEERAIVEKFFQGLWTFLWSATKVFVNPMSYTSGIQIGSLICQGLSWWTTAPSWVMYTCNSFGIVATLVSVWDGRKDLATAWSDYRNAPSYRENLESLQLLPFFRDYGDVVDNIGRRAVGNATVQRGKEGGYYDWSVLHPFLANRTAGNAKHGNGTILHDVERNYTIITMAHVIHSSESNPLRVQRSMNGTLLGAPVSMFFVNGTGYSAGMAAHHAFGVPSNSSSQTKRQGGGDCDGYANFSGDEWADNTDICGGGGTTTEDGITGVYYGMDMYGTESQWEEYDADVGGQYPSSNGLWDFASELSESTQDSQWWRACVCDQESSTWAWTGALQYTWNGGFNGYNDCYSGTCGST
jgi:hypothetical protein